ncbi:hypothetical protein BGW80DRAFT_1334817, partial [Lactifluus volemus]
MSNMLEINCLVFGDDHDHIFTIEIADTENIGALKDAIKEEKRNTFQNVDANTLILRKVSLPVDERLKENIGNIVGDKPLLSTEELSQKPFPKNTYTSLWNDRRLVSAIRLVRY